MVSLKSVYKYNPYKYKYSCISRYRVKKEYMHRLERYKFKKIDGTNNYYRVYTPKLFKIIPLFLSKRKATVVIAGDRTVYILDNLGFKRLAERNDEEIKDLINKKIVK